jgi:hypothetical protein
MASKRRSTTVSSAGALMIPLYLDELTTHARKVSKDVVAALMGALFEIHGEFDLPSDAERGFMAMADTSKRFHWLIRQPTAERKRISRQRSGPRWASL